MPVINRMGTLNRNFFEASLLAFAVVVRGTFLLQTKSGIAIFIGRLSYEKKGCYHWSWSCTFAGFRC